MDKREARGRHEEPEARTDRGRGGDGRGEYLPDAPANARIRGRDQRDLTPPPPPPVAVAADVEDRDAAVAPSHEEGKKKMKSQKKGLKKGRKDEDAVAVAVLAAAADRFNPEPPAALVVAPPPSHSPKKGAKKKAHERKRKRSRGGESDASEEEASAHQPHSKRKRGPRTPPPSMRQDHHRAGGNAEPTSFSHRSNFSDWTDEEEDATDRGGLMEAQAPLAPAERTPVEPLRRGGGHRMGRERERCNPLPIAPLLSQDPPMLLQTLTPQPLMSQPVLRKPPLEQTRSSSMGSNQSRTSARRLRSPSNESAHPEDPQGSRSRRGRLQGSSSRDRERERERPVVNEPPVAERKSRIDQLRRGEPSRSTSSGTQTNL